MRNLSDEEFLRHIDDRNPELAARIRSMLDQKYDDAEADVLQKFDGALEERRWQDLPEEWAYARSMLRSWVDDAVSEAEEAVHKSYLASEDVWHG